jgi:hypothetical protein
MSRLSRVPAGAWRRRYLTAGLLALSATMVWVVGAFADAGNPVLDTIRSSVVNNTDGTVTVYVRGQWNWISHGGDCNQTAASGDREGDRAGTGLAIVWNDPTEPGYVKARPKKGTWPPGGVGIRQLRTGDTVNQIDGLVHPVDRGNRPENYNVAGTDFPATQQFNDPAPVASGSLTDAERNAWKAGCGRIPLTATAGPKSGTNPESTGKTCADGTTTCSGHPWGSWGYEKNGGLGYTHTFASREDLTQVCVIFYDVHGSNQIPEAAGKIDVLGNDDNSIETNAFNATQGRNCIFFPQLTTQANPTDGTALPTEDVYDTASLTGAPPGTSGTVNFRYYPTKAACDADASFTGGTALGSGKSLSNGGSASSDRLSKPVTPGDYFFKAQWKGGGLTVTSDCTDTTGTEYVNVALNPVTPETGQKVTIKEVVSITGFISSTAAATCSPGNPPNAGSAGCVDFYLYDDETACKNSSTNHIVVRKLGVTPNSSGVANTGDLSIPFDNTDHTYFWLVKFNKDGVNDDGTSLCTESFSIKGQNLPSGVDP